MKNDYEKFRHLSYTLLGEKKYADALEAARRAVYLGDSSAYPYIYAAYALIKLNERDEAEFCLGKALTLEPTKTELYYPLGGLLYFRGDYDGAKVYLENYNKLYGENFMSLFTLGEIYTVQKDYQKALEMFDRSLSLKPDDAEAVKARTETIQSMSVGEPHREANSSSI